MQATTTKQTELIELHKRMRQEQEECSNSGLLAHYEHLLLSLRKIIESGLAQSAALRFVDLP